MVSFTTSNRHGYSVRYSPFDPDVLIVASSQYYGVCGAGTLYLLEQTEQGLREAGQVQWTDGLFDAAWSNSIEELVATSSGDGSLQLWNFQSLETGSPLAYMPAHTGEIYSIDWGRGPSDHNLLSASWDRTIKVWDSTYFKPISCFSAHSDVIFSATYSNFLLNTFSSVGADGLLNIWNSSSPKPLAKVEAHDGEVLTCSWSNFNSNVLATGASDGLIRGWDLRNLSTCLFELYGCEYAVRRIQFSPHHESVLVSAGYDFSTRIWDYERQCEPLETIVHHSEFVYGVEWNPIRIGQLADCGWDSLVHVFTPKCFEDV